MLYADDEQDLDLDQEEDADLDDENSDNEEDEELDDEDQDASEDDDESDDEDNKPVTRKELRELLESNKNKNNAKHRVSSKKGVTKQPTDTEKRLAAIEQQTKESVLLESKRTFGYEHNLSPKQVNHVFRLTKRPTGKFLNQPHVKAALDAIKSQENVAKNTPSGNGKRPRSNEGKSFTELKPEERQAGFAARRSEILARKR